VSVQDGLHWTQKQIDASPDPGIGNIPTLTGAARDALRQLGYGNIQIDESAYVCGSKGPVILMSLYTANGAAIKQQLAGEDASAFIALASSIHGL
jgi:hypothetical protein